MPVQCPWNRLWKWQVGQAATKSDGKSWCGAWKKNCFDDPKAWESPNCLVLSHTVYDFQPYLEMIASDSHYFQTREGWSLTDKLYSGYCNILRPPFGKHPFTMPGQHAVLQKCNMQTSNIPKKLEELCKWFDMAMSLVWLQLLTGEQLFATVCACRVSARPTVETSLWKIACIWLMSHDDSILSGWWFGTCFIFPNSWDDDPTWLINIFQRGRSTTNQLYRA